MDVVASFFTESAPPKFPFLTPLQNRILWMFHFKGYSYSRIAQTVKKRETAVKAQLARARAKIRNFSSSFRGE
jgi:hypothetical protein